MTIQRSTKSNRFCGPAALAALAGIHVDEAARMLRIVSGKTAVKGIGHRHMLTALERLGHRIQHVLAGSLEDRRAGRNPTLTQVLAGVLRGRLGSQRYLVLITGHYVTIQGRKLVDNKHPEGIALTACPYRRRRVRGIWAVTPEAPVPVPPRPPQAMNRSQFDGCLQALDLETDGSFIDAPRGFHFQSDLHALAITGTYEQALASLVGELPLVRCPMDCECRD